MKRGLLIFLAICTFATAMIPRDRRAINTDEEEERHSPPSTTAASAGNGAKEVRVCPSTTPCAWSIYRPSVKLIEMNITNTYCVCGSGTDCLYDEDDSTVNAFVYRCRPLVEKSDSES